MSTSRLQALLPKLRIHCWGGLGSQLFTAHLVLLLKSRFPNRRIQVVLHSSGVTKRLPEFNFETLFVDTKNKDDFSPETTPSTLKTDRTTYTKVQLFSIRLTRSLLLRTRFMGLANTCKEVEQLKPWTFVIRGHYTRINLRPQLIRQLYDLVLPDGFSADPNSCEIVLHYRLGDLLHLEDKEPISLSRVATVLCSLEANPRNAIILTDSSRVEYSEFVKSNRLVASIYFDSVQPTQLFQLCLPARYFIGTGAKISLWIAIFRSTIFDMESYLPAELSWVNSSELKLSWF